MIFVKEELLSCSKMRRAIKLSGWEVLGVWLAMKGYCDPKGDGFVPDEVFDELPGLPANARRHLQSLVQCGDLSRGTDGGTSRGHGLVDKVGDIGWELHDYLDHGPNKADVEERKRKAREKKARQRAKGKQAQGPQCPRVSPGDNHRDTAGDSRARVGLATAREGSGSEGGSGGNNCRPNSLSEALLVPIRERARFAVADEGHAQWLCRHEWPEVLAVSEALAKASGVRPGRLGASRDRGVEAVVALYADGWTQDELVRACGVVAQSDWWSKERRGLSSLTPEVVRRALEGAPDPSQFDAETQARIDRAKARRANGG